MSKMGRSDQSQLKKEKRSQSPARIDQRWLYRVVQVTIMKASVNKDVKVSLIGMQRTDCTRTVVVSVWCVCAKSKRFYLSAARPYLHRDMLQDAVCAANAFQDLHSLAQDAVGSTFIQNALDYGRLDVRLQVTSSSIPNAQYYTILHNTTQ